MLEIHTLKQAVVVATISVAVVMMGVVQSAHAQQITTIERIAARLNNASLLVETVGLRGNGQYELTFDRINADGTFTARYYSVNSVKSKTSVVNVSGRIMISSARRVGGGITTSISFTVAGISPAGFVVGDVQFEGAMVFGRTSKAPGVRQEPEAFMAGTFTINADGSRADGPYPFYATTCCVF
jgi:hypothetical protein